MASLILGGLSLVSSALLVCTENLLIAGSLSLPRSSESSDFVRRVSSLKVGVQPDSSPLLHDKPLFRWIISLSVGRNHLSASQRVCRPHLSALMPSSIRLGIGLDLCNNTFCELIYNIVVLAPNLGGLVLAEQINRVLQGL